MARNKYSREAAQAARTVRVVALAIVAVVAAVVVLFITGRLGSTGVAAEDLTRVLMVGAAADENGDVVAQVITVGDVSESAKSLDAVNPATVVTIPGTTYDTLADAYPFGGGAGVAEALARVQGTDPLPYVALNARALAAALEREGSVRLTLPAPMSVFDGEELFTLSSGAQELSPEEVGAVFKGAPYLAQAERAELDTELAGLLASLVAETPFDQVDTDLSAEAYSALQSSLASGR